MGIASWSCPVIPSPGCSSSLISFGCGISYVVVLKKKQGRGVSGYSRRYNELWRLNVQLLSLDLFDQHRLNSLSLSLLQTQRRCMDRHLGPTPPAPRPIKRLKQLNEQSPSIILLGKYPQKGQFLPLHLPFITTQLRLLKRNPKFPALQQPWQRRQ